jgi:mono/diheme cytochrome c family protein
MNPRTRTQVSLALLAGSLVVFAGCSAYDLGNSGNYYYQIPDIENPSWDQGISALVINKCASCHTPTTPWYKPRNVSDYPNASEPIFSLSNIGSEQFFDSKNALMPLLKKCIESTCGKENNVPMPPKYATPLNEDEKTALLNFIKPFIKETTSSPTTANLSASFKSVCGVCHGADGRSGFAKKIGETKYTLAEFQDIIQKGKGSMNPQPNYDLTNVAADHKVLFP